MNWYRDFFSGLAVDFWMAAAPPPDDDIAFLCSLLPDGGEILDLACGAGRHAIPLARAGFRVAGVDISPEFLERAKRASDVAIEWHQRDMRDLPWSARFDGAFCFGNSFGYLGRAGSQASIASIAKAMKPGARFVLDIGSAAESLLPSLKTRRRIAVGDILFLSSATYDVNESRLDVEYTFVRGSVHEKKTAHTWIFTSGELRQMFEASGLEVESMLASTDGEPFRLGSPRLLLTARKSA
ncbi:MAG TPA: class I SAM-dependent methyltransferase [Thermoanaerobaculia bacterium]|nr:class I SAM-dependent methyltransferase [Thermoanaerobaculia bacterium]